MTKNVLPIVKEQLPEFIRSEHPKFQTFIEAYYEYLEKTNDSDSLSAKDLFKKSANPSNIINNISEYRDVDTTLNAFVKYFQSELVPFSISGNKVSDGFILSKIRDIYLSKGTPNSYRLLFEMLYGVEIDLFETKENILSSSSGSYVDFTQIKVSIVGNRDEVEDFNFELSTINLQDSDNSETITVVDASNEGVDRNGDSVFVLYLSQFPDSDTKNKLILGKQYVLTDSKDKTKFIDIRLMKHLKNISVVSKSSGHRVGDLFNVKDDILNVPVQVNKITQGTVERIFCRNRGLNYRVGDSIEFINENSGLGTGAIAFITAVDPQGCVTEIDGIPVRTLDSDGLNRGFLSDDFQDTSVPISQGGFYSVVPEPTIRTSTGSGAKFSGWSSSVGSIEELAITESGFFDSDSNISVTHPITIDITDQENIDIGSFVEFQYFRPEEQYFAPDSEVLKIDFTVSGSYDSETSVNTVSNDSDFHGVKDSDEWNWNWKRRTKTGKRTIQYTELLQLTSSNYSDYLQKYLGRNIDLPADRVLDQPQKTTDISRKNILKTAVASAEAYKTSLTNPGIDLSGKKNTLTGTAQARTDSDTLAAERVTEKDAFIRATFPTTFNLGQPLFYNSGTVADSAFNPITNQVDGRPIAPRTDKETREKNAVNLINTRALVLAKSIGDNLSTLRQLEEARLANILKASKEAQLTTQIVRREVQINTIETVDSDVDRYIIELPVKWNSSTFTFETKNFTWYDSDLDSDFIAKYIGDSDFSFRNVEKTQVNNRNVFPIYINDSELYGLEKFHFDQVAGEIKYQSNFIDGDALLPENTNMEVSISTQEFFSPLLADSDGGNRKIGEFVSTGKGGQVQTISEDGRTLSIVETIAQSNGDSDLTIPSIQQIESYDNLENAILRIVRLNPVTGDILTPETFPISNTVTRYSAPDISTSFDIVSRTQKRFLDESGFLSSISGASLRDNFQISEYTYIVQSPVPIRDWREKVRKTIHPAGLILLGELNVNSDYTRNNTTTVESQPHSAEKSLITFDRDDDYYNDKANIGSAVFADSIQFESNPYNAVSLTNDATGTFLTADYLSSQTAANILSQYGNAYFDYEPVGSLEKVWLVFDSEAHFNDVVSNIDSDAAYDKYRMYFYYNKKDNNRNSNNWALRNNIDSDFFRPQITTQFADSDNTVKNVNTHYIRNSRIPHSRYTDDINISLNRTFYETFEDYVTYDSDLPDDFYARFCCDTQSFKKIPYERLDSDSNLFNDPVPRGREADMMKAQDLNLALRLDGSLKFKIGDITYTDIDAYEMKYNTLNDLRDSDISVGWKVPGQFETLANLKWTPSDSDYDSDSMLIAETRIRNKYKINNKNYFVKTKSPRTAAAYGNYNDSERDFTLTVFPFVDEINTVGKYQLIDRDSDSWDFTYILDRKRKK